MRRSLVAAAVVALALSVAGCGGAQTKSSEEHACAELQPLLAPGGRTAEQTRVAVTAVHGWSSDVIADDGFKQAGQAMYTAYQRSQQDAFTAAVEDLAARCRALD